ncbi:MAG TPA: response regulator [Verrucomicrobiae bacterium]|jgi:CheY-like chemotaxis protein|nr:response regulator [Verrucomicrobiae bacterium]
MQSGLVLEPSGREVDESNVTAAPGGDETILLAEDDPSLRISLRKTLSQMGYRVLDAATGATALELWKENRDAIGLLLTDMTMPGGMTGKELAQCLLQDAPKLKVIYMSAYSAKYAGKDFPLIEGDNFLAKPFDAAKLARTIRGKLDAN